MATKKAIQAAAAGLFILVLWSPAVQQQFNLVTYSPLVENRLKKPRPDDWGTLFRADNDFGRRYEEYFNDNYGLRDLLIRIKNQIDFSLFRKSENIVIGRDHWLFYKSYVEREEIDLERSTPEEWQRCFDEILQFQKRLSARGITLVMLPCPMKNTVYPEMLPASAPRRPNPTAFDRYRQFLRRHPEIVTIDPMQTILDLKRSQEVYHKTDFHWTDPAGARIAAELVNRLALLSGKHVAWDQPIEPDLQATDQGGENSALGLLFPVKEDMIILKSSIIRPPEGDYTYTQDANEWTYRTKLHDSANLIPPTVMFGDSFADAFLRAGFTAYFARFQKFYNWELGKKYQEIPEGTRFVVLQHIETFLQGMLNPALWPQDEAK